ncbi:dihydrofolate reductase family protein [Staphylococcus equorum]|uniref:Dihydrofolate reductase family protein n=1 Tax=Staphylococcus equorum TaxID=246432 RepID=A0A9X4R2F5_9STAP|nr:dihydrofolate reductase family protein [Staphylococcus equorum]MDG0842419.1 dihydrofolate reductase family protein [Staphylococcus equorum]MDG0858448.1 dihydrofolate reductase family protein [Staphylococcus equorum]
MKVHFINNNSKILLDLAVTLDGFIEGPNGEIDWCIMDPEMNFNTFLNQIDAIIYGRKSYDLWGRFQPQSADNNSEEQFMWESIHRKSKYVFTHQHIPNQTTTEFINNTDMTRAVEQIKLAHTNDIWLYGGSSIITSFIENNLIDEYRLSIHPVVLGAGKPLFENINQRLNLSLLKTNTFQSGVVQLIYGKVN